MQTLLILLQLWQDQRRLCMFVFIWLIVFLVMICAQFAQEADNIDCAALDSGAVGENSTYWKFCEECFNNGFAINSVDGATFADEIHFNHPIIDGLYERVQPSEHGVFTSSELHSLWKVMQKEYDKIFTNFEKSGNHHSSFTKSAMDVC
jgi:hypothetical protein